MAAAGTAGDHGQDAHEYSYPDGHDVTLPRNLHTGSGMLVVFGGEKSGGGNAVADLLPEHTEYRDEGCRVHPSCLDCPLPSCIYEERAGLRDGKLTRRRASLRARDMEVVRLVAAGWTTKDVGDTFGLSRRQVFRILAAEKLSVVLDEDGAIWTLSSSSASSPTSGLRRTS